MSNTVTRYFWATGNIATIGAVNAVRFDTYDEAASDLLRTKLKLEAMQSVKIYRETFDVVATVVFKTEYEIKPEKAA